MPMLPACNAPWIWIWIWIWHAHTHYMPCTLDPDLDISRHVHAHTHYMPCPLDPFLDPPCMLFLTMCHAPRIRIWVWISIRPCMLVFISCVPYPWIYPDPAPQVPSEVQPLETRSVGMAISVAVNFLFSFVIGQSFLPMMCTMEYSIYLFFVGWVLLMTTYTCLLLPETKGVPIEHIQALFCQHWLWRRVLAAGAGAGGGEGEEADGEGVDGGRPASNGPVVMVTAEIQAACSKV